MELHEIYQKVIKPVVLAATLCYLTSCTIHYNATINTNVPNLRVYGRVSGTYDSKHTKKKPTYIDMSTWNIK